MTEAAVRVSRRDLVCEITLNRPAHRNAMSSEMLAPIAKVFATQMAQRVTVQCQMFDTPSGAARRA